MARPAGFTRTFDTESGRVVRLVQDALTRCTEMLKSPEVIGEVGRGNVVVMDAVDLLRVVATSVDALVQLRDQERTAWVAHIAEGARRDLMARRAGPGAFAPVLQGDPGVSLTAAAPVPEPAQQ